eukprot:TRINITY_DN2950_c0_g4_i1.p1 TRINITY_DN2950_c0_g4~~TRINITY_DN2950_c0_g4_i1.p1  ORF type:complete len:949 (+),score=178.17 TRINITY_DN2950_c0_g4_i1:889-3735(+)
MQQQSEIVELIGQNYVSTYILNSCDPAVHQFRKAMTSLRLEESSKKETKVTSNTLNLPEYRRAEVPPANLPEKIELSCNLPSDDGGDIMKTKLLLANQTVQSLRDTIFQKLKTKNPKAAKGKTSNDFVLKVTGFSDWLLTDNAMLFEYDHICKCLSKSQDIELSLIEKTTAASLYSNPSQPKDTNSAVMNDLIYTNDKEDITTESGSICIRDLPKSHRIKIISIKNLNRDGDLKSPKNLLDSSNVKAESGKQELPFLFVTAEIYHGGIMIGPPLFSNAVPDTANPTWNQWIFQPFSPITIRNIPEGSRISFTVYRRMCPPLTESNPWQVKSLESKDTPLAWVSRSVYDTKGYMREGTETINMWMGGKVDPIGTCCENKFSVSSPQLTIEFESYGKRVVAPPIPTETEDDRRMFETIKQKVAAGGLQYIRPTLDAILVKDPLCKLTTEERTMAYEHRHYCATQAHGVPKFLLSCDWSDPEQVDVALGMLNIWAQPSAVQAMELLDYKYAHPFVRQFAVERMESMSTGDCVDYLLQLTQVVKYEIHHDSPLARFLLRKAWQNRKIGHALFWHLKAELHVPQVAERYCLLLEAYLRGCGDHRKELIKQGELVKQLVVVAEKVKNAGSAERKPLLKEGLKKIQITGSIQLPLERRMEVKGLLVDKCKYMDSKKLPLWVVFQNVEPIGRPISVIFKSGDDLRQDVLTLQMIRLMDKIWKQEGLDLRLSPYGCIATGDQEGMIEIVLNAETTANINKQAGGFREVFKKNTLRDWLRKQNPDEQLMKRAQETFCLSCAGYCVATFVLGIGDRHNDNIMMTKFGHLFHIDFGHFLGNFKEKFGIKRERAPFVFTPQYAAVLEYPKGEFYLKFQRICKQAYNILRHNSTTFINLFQMMVSTGIPELQTSDDINYLRESFKLGASDAEAGEYFENLILESYNTKTTVLNDAIHVWVHS